MSGVTRIAGRACPLGLANVDTDMIIAADHLKTTVRTGLGAHAFAGLRGQGTALDHPAHAAAPILIAGANFGCGSSREHAVWAMMDRGIQAVIAPSYSDIFSGNAFKNGLVAVELPQGAIDQLMLGAPDAEITIDLESMTVTRGNLAFGFTLDPFRRQCLIEGLDEIAITLRDDAAITAYEAAAPALGWPMGAAFTG
ncbi:MAG: 3-isopropylmalate dehydratase small subunit [Sphingobium sp.]|nr:3-isopropylmalate dehydratase small subunit [Sphingobium sp.]